MSATAWEVVPPLGISITPTCEELRPDSEREMLDVLADVSRETPVDDEAGGASRALDDVSRETSVSVVAGEEDVATDDVSRETSDPAPMDSALSLGSEDPRSEVSDISDIDERSVREVAAIGDYPSDDGDDVSGAGRGAAMDDLPEGMTPPESVKRILGLESDISPTTDSVKVLAVANQKGGVGKTTSAVNIAAALALLGYEVLLIDMDPQGNASTALGVEHPPGTLSTYEVLVGGKSLLDVVQHSPGLPGLTVAPATVDLAGAEIELVSEMGREGRLRSALVEYLAEQEARHRRLDFVLVDCPPSLGLLTINALTAVDEILIPLQCEYYALEGLGQLMGSVGLVREYLNPALSVAGIVLTMFDGRTKLAPQVADEARTHFPELVYEAIIPRSVRISEAPSYSQTVLTYDPASAGAKAYVACARELVRR